MATATINAGSTSGEVFGQNSTYLTARSTATSFWDMSFFLEYVVVGQEYNGSNYAVDRAFFVFDTSFLGSGATISDVKLHMKVNSKSVATNNFDIRIIKQDWSSQDPVTTGNRDTIFDNCLSGTLDQVWKNSADISAGNEYDSPSLDTSWINKTGKTYYSLNSSRDFGSNTPTDNELVYISITGVLPQLVITYEPASTSIKDPICQGIIPFPR